MGWLDLGKSDKSIDANNLFREAEKRERLLKELEAANNKNKAEAALRQKRNLKLQRDINETILKVQEITTLDNKGKT